MPELPEVHTVVTDLKNSVIGFKIVKAIVSERYRIYPNKEILINEIADKKIVDVHRIAKNILIELENGKYIHFHLAMTGRLLLKDENKTKDNWTHFAMKLSKDENIKFLKFTDMRMFGKLGLIEKTEKQNIAESYGPDALTTDITPEQFLKILQTKRSNIKNVLLDQSVISGLGNIYATDALFIAGINPHTSTKNLTIEQAEKLIYAIKEILSESIEHRGSTLPDKMYVDLFGKEGSHQKHFRIYMKESCPRCKSKTIVDKINGRSTYYCPQCQI
jgi:formamidopyrimidine-DNA glycosylase